MKKVNKISGINMAFSKGTETKETTGFSRYIGVAPFFIEGVNFTKEELQEKYPDRNYTKDIDYSILDENQNKIGTRVTFYLRSNPDHKESKGINYSIRATYNIRNEIQYTRDRNKIRVINNYGENAWITEEEFKTKALPASAIQSGFLTEGMRPALIGEVELLTFIRALILIPSGVYYDSNKNRLPKIGKDLADAEGFFTLDEIKKIASGDVSPIKNAIKHQPKNQIKLLVGVRVSDDNKEYDAVFTHVPIRFGATDYKYVDAKLQEAKSNGSFKTTNFGVYPFKFQKYQVNMTNFSESSNESDADSFEDPFADYKN
jgi:hypothetical protein